MNKGADKRLTAYFQEAEGWAADRERARKRSVYTAWTVASCAGVVAVMEAIALFALAPLKTVVPYTLLVDRQTGYIEALKPLDRETIAPDAALTRSFLAQYVIARESFDIDSLRADYRKVALWSAGEARGRYIDETQMSNPRSRLATFPRRALVQVQVRSLSSLGPDAALLRFVTVRTDPGGQPQPPQSWASVIKYRYSTAAMSAEDRMVNPLGFQVLRYRRDVETVPDPSPTPASTPSFSSRTGGPEPLSATSLSLPSRSR